MTVDTDKSKIERLDNGNIKIYGKPKDVASFSSEEPNGGSSNVH